MLIERQNFRTTRVLAGPSRLANRSRVIASICALAAVTPALAGASPGRDSGSIAAPSELQQREAKARYDAGVVAYREGRLEDAIAAFSAADRLVPRAALSYNIAKAYARLDDTAHALSYYREYLRRDPNAANAAEVQRAVRSLEHALSERQLQQLTVLSAPSGATVTIDGREMGRTPWTGELHPGQHQLTLATAHGAEQMFSIELPRERSLELSVRLSRSSDGLPFLSQASEDAADQTLIPLHRREPLPAEPPPAPSDHGPRPAWLIAGGALALAGAGLGVGFELAARHEDRRLDRYRSQLGPNGCAQDGNAPECRAVHDSAVRYDRDRTLSIVGFATASTAAVGTLVYWLWTGTRAPARGATDTRHLARLRVNGAAAAGSGTIQISGSF